MGDCVVRFAPSPSGYLHIGGARTAIFNWLFARRHGGQFILRIEDTDTERSSAASIQGILEGLQWLGLQWDAGPYFQSAFKTDHLAAAHRLLESGHAYKCFCGKEILDRKREDARRNKCTYRYEGACRDLPPRVVQAKEATGAAYVIRLKVPREDGVVAFEDRVYGRVEKKLADIEDFVLVRANGQPLYILANTVDDIRDGITHVIRGQDGLANTPKQILLYQGLGAPMPVFAHMSLTLDPQKAKISKRRHGIQVAIHYYREKGFLPWAMVNFLVRLGWATSDSREWFDREALIAAFTLEGIGRTNSVFHIQPDDPKFFTDPKLLNINAHYLRTLAIDSLLPLVKAQLESAGLWKPVFEGAQRKWFGETVALIRARYQLLTDFTTLGRAYFSDDFSMDENAFRKNILGQTGVSRWMIDLAEALGKVHPFDHGTVEGHLKAFIDRHQISTGLLVNAVRTAITGQSVGPEFVRMLLCIGRDRTLARLHQAVMRAQGHSAR